MIFTLEQLQKALEYWQSGNPDMYVGLCNYFKLEFNIEYDKTINALYKNGIIKDGNMYLGPYFDPKPRVEALKKLIEIKKSPETESWKKLFDYIFEDHSPDQINRILYLCNQHQKQAMKHQLQELLFEVNSLDIDRLAEYGRAGAGMTQRIITRLIKNRIEE